MCLYSEGDTGISIVTWTRTDKKRIESRRSESNMEIHSMNRIESNLSHESTESDQFESIRIDSTELGESSESTNPIVAITGGHAKQVLGQQAAGQIAFNGLSIVRDAID